MGRYITVFSNYWSEQHAALLWKAACYVFDQLGSDQKSRIDKWDLVSAGWLRVLRYRTTEELTGSWRHIVREMWAEIRRLAILLDVPKGDEPTVDEPGYLMLETLEVVGNVEHFFRTHWYSPEMIRSALTYLSGQKDMRQIARTRQVTWQAVQYDVNTVLYVARLPDIRRKLFDE